MFLDTHVHLRDFKETHKETIAHGLIVARDAGVDAVFDMPNTGMRCIDGCLKRNKSLWNDINGNIPHTKSGSSV